MSRLSLTITAGKAGVSKFSHWELKAGSAHKWTKWGENFQLANIEGVRFFRFGGSKFFFLPFRLVAQVIFWWR